MPSSRRRRVLLWLWGGLFAFLIVAIALLRIGSHRFDAPEPVHGSVWRVHGQVSDFFGAKADGRVLLFDAGADAEGRGLDLLLSALNGAREDVADIFFTHGHGDHVAAAPLCPRARLHGGSADGGMMAKKSAIVPGFARYMGLILPVPAVSLTDQFSGPTEVPVGAGKTVTAVPFPGHTPGSMIYFYDGVLFVGDSMNFEKDKLTFAMSVFSTDPKLNKERIAALPSLIKLDDVRVVCTAHGGCTPEAQTRRMLDDIIARAKS